MIYKKVSFIIFFFIVTITHLWAAENYPNKPINVYVPFAAGGASDALLRQVSPYMEKELGQKFRIFTNQNKMKPVEAVRRSSMLKNDGYHLVMGNLGTHGAAPILTGMQLRYDPQEDFVPVGMLGQTPMYVIVRKDLCLIYEKNKCKRLVSTLEDLDRYIAKHGKTVTMGYAGSGSISHMAAVRFTQLAKEFPTMIPYSGSTPALIDMSEGFLDVMVDQSTSALPYIKGGTVRPLAYTGRGDKKMSVTPYVPMCQEIQGWSDFNITGWNMLFAPQNTPLPIVEKLNLALRNALKDPVVRGSLALKNTIIYDDARNRPAFLKDFMRQEIEYWQDILSTSTLE
ncbi:MAG: tripartite tricarboxylate transporter substrate-binding protein [Pseudomonadota bacterium]